MLSQVTFTTYKKGNINFKQRVRIRRYGFESVVYKLKTINMINHMIRNFLALFLCVALHVYYYRPCHTEIGRAHV